MEKLLINSANKDQNNQSIYTNKYFCSEHLAKNYINGKKKPQGIEIVRSLQ